MKMLTMALALLWGSVCIYYFFIYKYPKAPPKPTADLAFRFYCSEPETYTLAIYGIEADGKLMFLGQGEYPDDRPTKDAATELLYELSTRPPGDYYLFDLWHYYLGKRRSI